MQQDFRIGLVGVGRMGSGMAANWLAKGFAPVLWDTDPANMQALAGQGALAASSLAHLVREADVVFTSLPSEAVLIDCARQIAACGGSARVRAIVETSTVSAACKVSARDLVSAAGIGMLDAPLIGGAMQARAARLTVLVGGDADLFERCLPLLKAISANQHHIGAFGEATKLKLVVNHLVGISNVVVAETMALARRAGLDLATVDKVIGGSPAGSGLWSARAALILDEAWGERDRQSAELLIPLKDNALIHDWADPLRIELPMFEAARRIYARACDEGRQQQDPAALYATLLAMSLTNAEKSTS